jgi:4-hydroxy-tetrahydrodipicolinate reductase
MKLVLLGYGRMGSEVEKLALRNGHEVVLKLDIESNRDGAGLTPEAVSGGHVVVDFTWPEAVLPNLKRVAELGLPMVEGTTGWYDQIDEAREIVANAGTGFIYAANFSIGANLLIKLAGQAAQLFDRFDAYDPFVFEHHHRGKVDAPSGTAVRLAETVVASMERKSRVQVGNPDRQIAPEALHVASLRAGTSFGQHLVGFDSAADVLELKLTSRGREGLATGALFAADWIRDKKGFFEFSECLGLK